MLVNKQSGVASRTADEDEEGAGEDRSSFPQIPIPQDKILRRLEDGHRQRRVVIYLAADKPDDRFSVPASFSRIVFMSRAWRCIRDPAQRTPLEPDLFHHGSTL